MKKFVVLGLSILLLFMGTGVSAKDTMYSLNKYEEEELEYILKSYKGKEPDGYVVAGISTEKKKNDIEKNILLLKYSRNGNILWKYNYNISEDGELLELIYTYDDENQIKGFLLLLNTVKDEETEKKYIILKINLDGKLDEEKELALAQDIHINKIIEVGKEEYLLSGNIGNTAFIEKYDKSLNPIWKKDYSLENTKTSITDILYIEDIGYYAIVSIIKEDLETFQLIKFDINGNFQKVIKENFEEEDNPRLEKGINSYLLYGITHEIKLAKQDSPSYYIIKYNLNEEEEWETIGNTPIDEKKALQLQTIIENNEIKEYYVLSINSSDNSIEVINVDKEGLIEKKIKKLKNDYYRVNRFLADGSSIYFVGQIDCPEDDNCDYHNNSLFLVSDEDKVIEVKDNDTKTVFIITGIIVIFFVGMYFLQKKNRLERKKKH